MKKTVLVTGTGGRSVGSGILHALLRTTADVRDRWHVIAADANPFAWGLYLADDYELLPMASSPDYIETLLRVIARRQVHAIIPGTESEADLLLKNKDQLGQVFLIANRLDLMPLMMDKFAAARKLADLGYRTIPSRPISDWETLSDQYGFPLVIKPTTGTGGSRGLHLVCSAEEMRSILPTIENVGSPCVQPYVGDAENEFTVGVLSDFNGTLIDSIVMKRKLLGLSLLTQSSIADKNFAISTGYSQGFIIRDKYIQDFCEGLAGKLGSRGPLNIQLRIDKDSGTPYVLEIHPRFSGTTPIRADVGFNEVDILLRCALLSESFGRLSYKYDVAAIRAFEHLIVPICELASN